MNFGEPPVAQAPQLPPAASPFHPDDPNAWATGEVVRLFLTPAIVTVIFVSGIYWIKWQLPAGGALRNQASTVEVHLLPRPGPETLPVSAPETMQATAEPVSTKTDEVVDQPDRPAENPVTAPAPSDPVPVEASAPINQPTSSRQDAPPAAETLKFQQALRRHLARYERSHKAAHPVRRAATVDLMFSMRRDGTVLGVSVTGSSGQSIFDKEAVNTIWQAQPLPPIPPGLPDMLTMDLQMSFDPK